MDTRGDSVDAQDSSKQSDSESMDTRGDSVETEDSSTQSDSKSMDTQGDSVEMEDFTKQGDSKSVDAQLETEQRFMESYTEIMDVRRSRRANKSIPANRFDPSSYVSQRLENAARYVSEM
jgi:hypothetical protein